ncbi:hypothetical protein [Rhodococcus sp. (in: high G+C Gram-positive bacteria)]|uniref:hypothetical protein n=1 Tax=Rhodococcus sp. TaxID=1831 RepID=UPI002580B9AA|nr:hypothetical protein [Rhodococcus sp. (in: high G+C Gram-positive bacteria)]MBQ7803974.1 hypothetical protein [Rhodococcus sp. (in: high G+C Gram-positive bacteria)]
MTELAYMIREDWGQNGTAMVPQSALIREWAGGPPYLFAVSDTRQFTGVDRSADVEVAEFVAPAAATRTVFNISELSAMESKGDVIDHAIVVLHPYEQHELETLRGAVAAGAVTRLFVLVWSPRDAVRAWLDGLGAIDLHTRDAAPAPDAFMFYAAKMIVRQEYNGLSSGHGKDAVVQLVRAFADNGYPVDVDAWVRAYFAAGGSFSHAESLEKLVKEIQAGTRHRVKRRYRDDIFDIIRERAAPAD